MFVCAGLYFCERIGRTVVQTTIKATDMAQLLFAKLHLLIFEKPGMLKVLHRIRADCNKSGEGVSTPLSLASRVGHVDIVDMLIKGGADCNKSEEDNTTPLCKASRAGDIDIVYMLIKSGTDWCK